MTECVHGWWDRCHVCEAQKAADVSRNEDHAPLALTEAHLPALERAIRAKGFTILVDTVTGEVVLRQAKEAKR